MWVGQHDSGDGRFVFVPDPGNPLVLTRRPSGQQIRPEMMYTDGGSIPRLARVFRGLSPWGYAPAYMIHDWLFQAHHCNMDGIPTPREAAIASMTFEDSAAIIVEAIKALVATGKVKPDDIALSAIGAAVGSRRVRTLWNRKGACAVGRVSDADKAAAEAAIPGSSALRRGAFGITLPDGTETVAPPTQIMASFSF